MINTYRRHTLTAVLVPGTLHDPAEAIKSIMANLGAIGKGWDIGGAWQSPFSGLYRYLNVTEFGNLRIFSEGDSRLARFSFPVKKLIEVGWLPAAIVNPAGQMIWIEWEKRPKWDKKVLAWFKRFEDCYAVVTDLLLPDDDYRVEGFIVQNGKQKGKVKHASATSAVRH